MSLDQFRECSSCKQHTAAYMWLQTFCSFEHARATGSGVDFLNVLMPRPGLLKVEVCFSCNKFVPTTDFTEEEKAGIVEFGKSQRKSVEAMEMLGKVLGLDKKDTK